MKTILMLLVAVVALAGFSTVRAEEGTPEVYYKEGVHIDSADGKNTLHIQGRVQVRATYDAKDGAKDADTFAVQRGKIKLEGNVLSKNLKYGFQMNAATRTGTTSGQALLEDYWFDYKANGAFGVKAGQFKVPFLLQELTSSGKQQFVDRSTSTGLFNLGRDLGVTVHGALGGGLKYDLFGMNGDGVNTVNTNRALLMGARFELPLIGMYETYESDVNDSDEPNLGVGAAYAFNERGSASQGGTVTAFTKASLGTLDIGYKYKGASLQLAGMAGRSHEGTKVTNYGLNAQLGYFLVPKTFEIAVRGSGAVLNKATANQYEYAGALNWFFKKHTVKWQNDVGLLKNVSGFGKDDIRFRSQMQVIF